MALFKINHGGEANLPKDKKDGFAYVTYDKNAMFIDVKKRTGTDSSGQPVFASEISRIKLYDYLENRILKVSGSPGKLAYYNTDGSLAPLTSSLGSASKPIYLSGGVPMACSDTLGVSITGNAATATTATSVSNAGIAIADEARHVWFSDSGTETRRVSDDNFKYNPKTNLLTTNISGNAATATKATQLTTARNFSLSGGATSNTAAFNGTGNVTLDVTDLKEAYLSWGGKNIYGNFNPLDAALNPVLGANRLAGINPAGVTIEYSNDGGNTWTDYGADNNNKKALFTTSSNLRIAGPSADASANSKLRITIDGVDGGIYTQLRKLHIYISTNYSNGATLSMESYDYNSSTSWHSVIKDQVIAGQTGWNVINFYLPGSSAFGGTNSNTHQRKIRLTFSNTSVTSGKEKEGLRVYKIYGYGGVGWQAPSVLATNGVPYSYDYNLSVTFPANVTATNFVGTATKAAALTTNAGSSTRPVYFTNGVPTICDTSLAVSVTGTAASIVNEAGMNASLNKLSTGSSTPVDADYYISQYVGGGTTTTTYHRRPMSALWLYVKGKADTVYLAKGNYAGSASAGGSANSAVKLDTATAGSATQPIYFSGGKPVACTYTLAKSVPSDAKFTDTNTWRPVVDALDSTVATSSLSANQGNVLNTKVEKSLLPRTTQITATMDWNTLTTPGYYKVAVSTWGDASALHSPNAYKRDLYSYGLLIVYTIDTMITQVYIPHYAAENSPVVSRMSYSSSNNPVWLAWAPIGRGTNWSQILDKPTTFTPTAHTHSVNNTIVADSATATVNTTAALTNGNVFLNHIENNAVKNSHKLTGSGGLTVTSDASGNLVFTGAASTHDHTIAQVTGLSDALAKKSDSGHTHTIGQVTNLQTILDDKAAKSHTHAIADITDLQTTLDNKAAKTHSHSYLPLSGGTETGAIKSAYLYEGAWATASSMAPFFVNVATTASAGNSYQSWFGGKTQSGSWTMGALSGREDLYFGYVKSDGTGTAQVHFGSNGSVYGAVWNDYAEYRQSQEEIEPGYCVVSNDNGIVQKTSQKLQSCDGVTSDTFGFAIGETEISKTPLAVAGRVLVYYHGDKKDYHAGDVVCAGSEGKVLKMTREEIKEYPDRIVGTVSEIPSYEIWGTGNIKVNNRIWIKVR